MSATATYDGLLFSERDGTEVSFTFTHGALYIGVRNSFGDEVEEAIGEADVATLVSYLNEKMSLGMTISENPDGKRFYRNSADQWMPL